MLFAHCECVAHGSGNISFKHTVESEAIRARNMVDQSIELIDYDPTWPTRFVEQKKRLTMILNPWLAGEIEHIGSTSVPGLRSMPIVDIFSYTYFGGARLAVLAG